MKKFIYSFILIVFILAGCGDKKNVEQGDWLIMKDDPNYGIWAVRIVSSEIVKDENKSGTKILLKIKFGVQNGNEKRSIVFGKTEQTIEINGNKLISGNAGLNEAKENSIDPMKESQRTVSFEIGEGVKINDNFKWLYNDGKEERTIKFYPTK